MPLALAPGTRIGAYEVVAMLGEGGMGEVYRARDTRLDRDVALKILPEAFAADPDRLTRFEREAKTLASLSHTNIATIHGVEQHALVMELVEGEDLSAHIRRGPIPLADALPVARQLVDALEAAHESGVVHRDLKPANVKVRSDGTVKVLDFGLAKALTQDSGPGTQDAQNSPTLTARATQMGMILGTAAYMAPEQARGRAVDRRADIWAFGVVLYEMLSGRRAFEGDDVSITLASVLKEDVKWDALPADLPLALRTLLRRCLEKDPKRRLGWIGEARHLLEESVGAATAPAAAEPSTQHHALGTGSHRVLPWSLAAILALALATTLVLWSPWATPPAPPSHRLEAKIGAEASLPTGLAASAVISPDGETLAFAAIQDGQSKLFTRRLDQLQANALPGTEGASQPFFSPTGQWIAFFASGKLLKIAATGGGPVPLCDAPSGRGGTWLEDDTIVFTPTSAPGGKLHRVPATGGSPVEFGTLDQRITTQRFPQALPGLRGVLYTEHASTTSFDSANVVVVPIDRAASKGGTAKVVVRGGYFGRYVTSGRAGDGHILYFQQAAVFAVPFNLDRLETTGPALPVLDGVTGNPDTGGGQLALSGDGTLVYVPGAMLFAGGREMNWILPDGKISVFRQTPARWSAPAFSPDGKRVAMSINDGKENDIFVYDVARDAMTQLTFDPANDRSATWSPDGSSIVYSSTKGMESGSQLYLTKADGAGTPMQLTSGPGDKVAHSWHPLGKYIAYQELHEKTSWDLMLLPMEGDAKTGWKPGKPVPWHSTPGGDLYARFSPDGKWIAYFSTETGTAEVYVRPTEGAGLWKISSGGGSFPHWSKTTNELLFFRPSTNAVMTVPYSVVGNSFQADKIRPWTSMPIAQIGSSNSFDIHPDGKRIVALAAADTTGAPRDTVVVVSNFHDYLRARVPAGR